MKCYLQKIKLETSSQSETAFAAATTAAEAFAMFLDAFLLVNKKKKYDFIIQYIEWRIHNYFRCNVHVIMLLTFKTDTLSEIQYKNVLDIFDVSPWKTVVEIFIRLCDLCTTY